MRNERSTSYMLLSSKIEKVQYVLPIRHDINPLPSDKPCILIMFFNTLHLEQIIIIGEEIETSIGIV